MKNLLTIIFALLVFGSLSAQTKSDLLIYYNFDNNLHDQSGNGNDAKDVNGLGFGKDSIGQSNYALHVPGYANNGAYASIPDVVDGLDELTISIVANLTSYDSQIEYEEAFISFGTLQGGGNGATGIFYRKSDNKLMFLLQTNKGNFWYLTPWKSNWTNQFQQFSLTYNMQTGTMNCYVGGIFVGAKTGISGSVETIQNFAGLGKHWWQNGSGNSTRMEFYIDDVFVFKKALDSSQIRNLRTYGAPNDTCYNVVTIYDTVKVYRTFYDTVTIVKTVYDTISVTDTLIIDFQFSSANGTENGVMKLYPNPATENLMVYTPNYNNMSNVSLKITNINGIVEYNSQISSETTSIDISHYAAGVYFVYVLDGANIQEVKKLLIK